MKWLNTFFIIGERDAVDEAMQFVVFFGQFVGESRNLFFELDITDKNVGVVTGQLPHLFLPFGRPNGVNHSYPGFDEYPCDMPRDALSIGDAHHEDALVGELEEIGGHQRGISDCGIKR
jgi:hypothetical protein